MNTELLKHELAKLGITNIVELNEAIKKEVPLDLSLMAGQRKEKQKCGNEKEQGWQLRKLAV